MDRVPQKAAYHHGDLRRALVEAALQAIAEGGVAAVSMADAARRAGVSTAAPYRHFPGRRELLAATAAATATALAERLEAASGLPAAEPVEALARAAGEYTLFYLERGAGIDLVYASDLRELRDTGLADAGRRIMDLLFPATQAVTGDPARGLVLLEQLFAVAHGYAQLRAAAFSTRMLSTAEDAAAGARSTVRLIAAASRPAPVSPGRSGG
ncbi:TetR/AcrR family transcriptional regulator [Dactylosporangium sp. CA-092794]|uniref:TetR/AcrR family transcriptional regulator n=1 Tax=Dactylosporangium sp. CA-092794 TaxID=3239929 RepID=UPI003D9498A5